MAAAKTIALRLTIVDPLPGVSYSLRNKRNEPVGSVVAGDGPVSFDAPVRVETGPKFLGAFLRREGPTRRFVHVAVGEPAGQSPSEWNRRAKIDIHLPPSDLLEKALAGALLEARLPGKANGGGPAYATARPFRLIRN